MAFLALLWKARVVEKYRANYEREKMNSLMKSNCLKPKNTLYQRWSNYSCDAKMRMTKSIRKICPEGSILNNWLNNLRTDQTFPNFVWKSVLGFVGGIVLTYFWFMFFVFQLSISLIHATFMSSIIGVLLTLGLAFSYRIRCLVFLLIPQFFSRVGRYTLTCYALVLILTGPATNTLKNSEVLSESMACSQEQIKTSVNQIKHATNKPLLLMKDSIGKVVEAVKTAAATIKDGLLKTHRLVLAIVDQFKLASSWLISVVTECNRTFGTPYERCARAIQDGVDDCRVKLSPDMSAICNAMYLTESVCGVMMPLQSMCVMVEFGNGNVVNVILKKLKILSHRIQTLLRAEIKVNHSYSFSSNASSSASQIAAGIVTEIRNRADPLLTWLSFSSCLTSIFLILIIFRAKNYQHMFQTRAQYDNRYITRELRALDFARQKENRDTVLPLNRRERAKYISNISFRLVESERRNLTRTLVFVAITTFKLLIHITADYSLYWVLMTIRHHGRFQTSLEPGPSDGGVEVKGAGPLAYWLHLLVKALSLPLTTPVPDPTTCLPNPHDPDMRRYIQIGILIFLLWFFALFEPYGLRLRHVIMGHYQPDRAKERAVWLHNHIVKSRSSFMKHARRKLHREYKYYTETKLTFHQWLLDTIPFACLRYILGIRSVEPYCLLCGTTERYEDPDTKLTLCKTPDCPGRYCVSCYADIGKLCTICLSPQDYGDLSDVSLENGSSDDDDVEKGINDQSSDSSDDGGKKGRTSMCDCVTRRRQKSEDVPLHSIVRDSKGHIGLKKKTITFDRNEPIEILDVVQQDDETARRMRIIETLLEPNSDGYGPVNECVTYQVYYCYVSYKTHCKENEQVNEDANNEHDTQSNVVTKDTGFKTQEEHGVTAPYKNSLENCKYTYTDDNKISYKQIWCKLKNIFSYKRARRKCNVMKSATVKSCKRMLKRKKHLANTTANNDEREYRVSTFLAGRYWIENNDKGLETNTDAPVTPVEDKVHEILGNIFEDVTHEFTKKVSSNSNINEVANIGKDTKEKLPNKGKFCIDINNHNETGDTESDNAHKAEVIKDMAKVNLTNQRWSFSWNTKSIMKNIIKLVNCDLHGESPSSLDVAIVHVNDNPTEVQPVAIENCKNVTQSVSRHHIFKDAQASTRLETCSCAVQYVHVDTDRISKYTQKELAHKELRKHKTISYDNFENVKDKSLNKIEKEENCSSETYVSGIENTMEIYDYTTNPESLDKISSLATDSDTTMLYKQATSVNYEAQRRKRRIKIIAKRNQSTTTDKAILCDVSTNTTDYWNLTRTDVRRSIRKKEGGDMPQGAFRGVANRRACKKMVKFMSGAEIIPNNVYNQDILSPSRYLLESQKYYNELFSPKYYTPHVLPAKQPQKPHIITTRNYWRTQCKTFKGTSLDGCCSSSSFS